MIQHFLSRIRSWWAGLLPHDKPYTIIEAEDIPPKLDARKVYLAGSEGSYWLAAMRCPCGCGETLHMNLLTSHRPCWSVKVHSNKTVSMTPSLWKKSGCRSHFFLKQGRIKWSS